MEDKPEITIVKPAESWNKNYRITMTVDTKIHALLKTANKRLNLISYSATLEFPNYKTNTAMMDVTLAQSKLILNTPGSSKDV